MSPYSRRSIVIGGLAVALAGCVSDADDGSNDTDGADNTNDTMPSSPDNNQSTDDSAERSETDDREAVPEGVPLMNPLPDLVEAEDREAFASTHDVDYQEGVVHVEIELAPDGEKPDQYLGEVTSEYANILVAYVAVDDLVALARDDNVHLVRTKEDPQPH